jgi:hypothetical protein
MPPRHYACGNSVAQRSIYQGHLVVRFHAIPVFFPPKERKDTKRKEKKEERRKKKENSKTEVSEKQTREERKVLRKDIFNNNK